MLNFNKYQEFVDSLKIYPKEKAIVYPTLGLMGEAGEVCEKVKKWQRGDKDLDHKEVAKELGDVLFYIAALADDLGYTIHEIAEMNVEKLSSRRDRGVLQGEGDNR